MSAAKGRARVLKAIRDGIALDLSRDWVTVVELRSLGLVKLRKIENGQLLIEGSHPKGKRCFDETAPPSPRAR